MFYDVHGIIKFGSMLLFLSSLGDFLVNITPRSSPIILANGNVTYNDGQTLKNYSSYRGAYTEIITLSEFYIQKKYEEGLKYFQENKSSNLHVLQLGSALLLATENYAEAITLIESYKRDKKWTSDDYINYAIAHSWLQKHEKAIELYDLALGLNPRNFVALNNKSYTHTLLKSYEKAITEADKAIDIEPNFSYSYNNRGLAKIISGDEQGGILDVKKSLELDENNSNAYKNNGI